MTARILNATLQNDVDQLTPLVNPQTNVPIANFPANSAALTRLNCKSFASLDTYTSNMCLVGAQKRGLGIDLAMTDPGESPPAAAKSNFFIQLRTTIGLKPHSA